MNALLRERQISRPSFSDWSLVEAEDKRAANDSVLLHTLKFGLDASLGLGCLALSITNLHDPLVSISAAVGAIAFAFMVRADLRKADPFWID